MSSGGVEPTIGELAVELRAHLTNQDHTLREIKDQVIRTNGRVTALETKNAVEKALAEREQQAESVTSRNRRWIIDTLIGVAASGGLVLGAIHYL